MIKRFIGSCHVCKRSKAFHEAYSGGLKQLQVPTRPWTDVSVDFVVDLPKSKSASNGVTYSNIMTVTDRLTKWRYYLPCNTVDAGASALFFHRHIFARHGLPQHISSDRGSQFLSVFWNTLCQRLGIKQQLSSAFHPETDGQSENTNQNMEQYLRAYCNYMQDDWVDRLPAAEFAANSDVSETTKVSPFYADYGTHPGFGLELPREALPLTAKAFMISRPPRRLRKE